MTSLTSLLRDHTADPQPDRMPHIAAVVEREGRADEFLDALRDCTLWKAQPSTSQDIAAAVVGSRLGSGFEWVGMELFEQLVIASSSKEWCHVCSFLHIDCSCETKSVTRTAHRIARFRHRATGAVMHLVPGLACSVCSGTGRLASFDATHAGPSRYLGSITCPDCPERLVAPFLVGQTPMTLREATKMQRDPKLREESSSWIISESDLPATSLPHRVAAGLLAREGLALPSPAEWRHAAYAGATTRWPWGDDFEPEGSRLVWHAGNSGDVRIEIDGVEVPDHIGRQVVRPEVIAQRELAGQPKLRLVTDHLDAKAWNAFGLVDCLGNVDEWLADGTCIGGSYEDTPELIGPDADSSGNWGLHSVGFRAFASVPGVE